MGGGWYHLGRSRARHLLSSVCKSLSQHGCSAPVTMEQWEKMKKKEKKGGGRLREKTQCYSSGTRRLRMTGSSKGDSLIAHKSCDLCCGLADLSIRDMTLTYSAQNQYFAGISVSPPVSWAHRHTHTGGLHSFSDILSSMIVDCFAKRSNSCLGI